MTEQSAMTDITDSGQLERDASIADAGPAFVALSSQVDVNPDTNAASPALGTTEAEKLAGDVNDDDATYIDTLFEQNVDPYSYLVTDARESEVYNEIPRDPETLAAPTRLLSTISVPLAVNYAPVMLVPADPNRKRLLIWATGDFKISGESNTAASVGDFPASTLGGLEIAEHTGAVWVAPASTATATVISVIALSVTK